MPSIKPIDGIEIFVSDDGYFFATINGKIIKRNSLSSLKRFITSSSNAVQVIIADIWVHAELITEQIRDVDSSRFLGKHGNYKSYKDVYLYDEAIIAELESIKTNIYELVMKWNRVLEKAERITIPEFKEIQKRENAKKGQDEAKKES